MIATEPNMLPNPDKNKGRMMPVMDSVTKNNPAHIETEAKPMIR